MCLIVFAFNTHPKYKLIVAANRDEFYKRSTRTAQFWTKEGESELLAGKDLEAGGTWMGIHKTRKWSALTNYRDLSNIKADAPSRGELVYDYLLTNTSPNSYINELKPTANSYNGFNILVGNAEKLFHYSNYSDEITEIKSGIHGVSNALLDTKWPKLERAKKGFKVVINQSEIDREALFKILKDDTQANDEALPDTGIPYELEKSLSSIYINRADYGTLCSTLLFMDYEENVEFIERRFDPSSNAIISENTFKF